MSGWPRHAAIYTCVLLDPAGNVLKIAADVFADELSALRDAAVRVFCDDGAAGYDLWSDGRKLARFMKPGLSRSA